MGEFVIECEPNDGCLRCNWARKHVADLKDVVNSLNQEVEKRIKERMPSKEEIEEWMQENRWASAIQYVNWLCSRLTPQVTPQDTPQVQRTEGGGE